MKAICGIKCDECEYLKSKKCKGCTETEGCPFGKKCFISQYIKIGGMDNYELMKKELIDEINALEIEFMPKIKALFPLIGSFVNLEYQLPNGKKVTFLHDDEIYLGCQVECEFNDDDIKKCFGVVVNMDFIIISQYEEDGKNPELLMYKKR